MPTEHQHTQSGSPDTPALTHLAVSTAGMNHVNINIPLQITSEAGHPTT